MTITASDLGHVGSAVDALVKARTDDKTNYRHSPVCLRLPSFHLFEVCGPD